MNRHFAKVQINRPRVNFLAAEDKLKGGLQRDETGKATCGAKKAEIAPLARWSLCPR